MASELYYCQDGQQYGPCSLEQLQALIISDQVSREASVWKEGMAEFVPVADFPGLCLPQPRHSPAADSLSALSQASSSALPQPSPVHARNYGGSTARRHGEQIPRYPGITIGAIWLKVFSVLNGCIGVILLLKALIGFLTPKKGDSFDGLDLVGGGMSMGLSFGMISAAVFLWMAACVAEAIRDTAINSFR